jgi:hypothetical protein
MYRLSASMELLNHTSGKKTFEKPDLQVAMTILEVKPLGK